MASWVKPNCDSCGVDLQGSTDHRFEGDDGSKFQYCIEDCPRCFNAEPPPDSYFVPLLGTVRLIRKAP